MFSKHRKAASDRYLDAELSILSECFWTPTWHFQEASLDLDKKEAVDLILPDGTRIAKRIRSPHQKARHYGEAIFRNDRQAHYETEWEKILKGTSPRYYLYSFAKNDTEIDAWWLLDMEALREGYQRGWAHCRLPEELPFCGDGIVAVKLDGFPGWPYRPFVIATNQVKGYWN